MLHILRKKIALDSKENAQFIITEVPYVKTAI